MIVMTLHYYTCNVIQNTCGYTCSTAADICKFMGQSKYYSYIWPWYPNYFSVFKMLSLQWA